jgi:hypothetical protein
MSRLKPKLLATGLSVVAGAGLGAAALALGGTAGSTQPAAVWAHPLKARAPDPDRNRRPLSTQTQARLSTWARRLASCLSDRGLAVGAPRAGGDEVVIRVPTKVGSDPTVLLARMPSCAKALGNPPPASAVVLKRGAGAIQIFEPKTCPLPKKVAQ